MVRTFLVNNFGHLFPSPLVGDQSRSGQDPEELLAPGKGTHISSDNLAECQSGSYFQYIYVCITDRRSLLEPTECTLKLCRHPSAYKWVQCGDCHRWFHCVCGGFTDSSVCFVEKKFKVCTELHSAQAPTRPCHRASRLTPPKPRQQYTAALLSVKMMGLAGD